MELKQPWALVGLAAFAIPTAILTPRCLPAAAALAAIGWLLAIHARAWNGRYGLVALPALLASLQPPQSPRTLPRPGPVQVRGIISEVRRTPATGESLIVLGSGERSLRLYLSTRTEALPGDRLQAVACLAHPVVPDQPPGLQVPPHGERLQAGAASLPRLCHGLRRRLERELLRLVPGDLGALLGTLTLGRATATSGELVQAHQGTGLSHLLAVSGAHAAMLAFLLGLGGNRRQRLSPGRLRTTCALGALLVYGAITGAEPPVFRSVIAFGLAMLAVATGRPLSLTTALLLPALLTVLWQPAALTSVSFLLSYAAVVGLSLAGRPADGPLARWVYAPLQASVWATLMTAPLTLAWFGQLAPWSIALTPILAPLVAFLLLGSLLASSIACIAPALSAPMAWLLEPGAALYAGIVCWADSWPGTPIHAPAAPPDFAIALAVLLAGGVLLRWPQRRGIAAAASLCCLPFFVPLPADQAPSLRLLAVGHGQAALVRLPGGAQVAIDCGSQQLPLRAARRMVEQLPVRRLDLLVITHGDHDHISGLPWLLQRVAVPQAVMPASLRQSAVAAWMASQAIPVRWLAAGERAQPLPGLELHAPRVASDASGNDQSLWVHLDLGSTTALLAGDAEAAGVHAAIGDGFVRPVDLLVLPHHGRPNPAAALLLQCTQPLACFASAATGDGETAAGRLVRAAGSDLWVTGLHGNLELRATSPPRVHSQIEGRPLLPRRP